ncbi:RagB/SusD family nutrient uptake outer membrane protein [Mucilaginibacter endophyticus]|uniref:RagB/SusD family nutrient uptake outer membrane protein n=1 Tax=Mucilaginibacter endophyticus TaxID=2675003 RepID=UPI000E0D825C|nr:RagB/SusD family nutrient uptake outer membrane protein [Mucilaginibacter endophyticus]
MKFLNKCILILALGIVCTSCKKYLDVTPENVGTIDYAFRNRNEAENYLFTCYSTLQKLFQVQYDPAFCTSAEIYFPNNLTDNQYIDPVGFNLIRGNQTSANPGLNFWDGTNQGQPMFVAIRRCNTMLENIDKPVDLTPAEKKRWVAEVKFLKAYYHFVLFRLYGPIPITDKNLPINSSIEEVRVQRAPVDSVVNYMVNLIDQAATDLPVTIQNQVKELGRITKPIALSVKAQILATAASPLFNGNPDYAGLKSKSGALLFPAASDPAKWDRAAAAVREAIDVCESNGNSLHKFIPPANISKLSDSLRTELDIQTAITEKWELNTEMIWALNPYFGAQTNCGPRLTAKAAANPAFQGTFAVPLAEQELFYTHNGVPINEDKTWDYNNRYSIRTGDYANRFYLLNGYQTVKAHFDREPRFYADLAFDGSIWFGNGLVNQEALYSVQGRGSSSFAGPTDNIRINVTGYWPKKLVNYLTVYDDGYTLEPFRLPVIRLAGLYLLYAETLNEQGKPYTDVVPWLDKVRKRAGLPGIVDAWKNYSRQPTKFMSQTGLRAIIHQETRIELAFECQPGWDLRRWKELQSVLSEPVKGWNIYEQEPENYYKVKTLAVPVFNVKDYLWPIQDNDLIVNPNLTQNPNW